MKNPAKASWRALLFLGAAALIAVQAAPSLFGPAQEDRSAAGLGAIKPAAARDMAADAGTNPVVVELYTSQGCNSCPPADAFLGELAMWPGVIALAFHVDYWDYIGWKDPFASPAYTQRQHSYKRSLDSGYVYTPQMVIDGRDHAVGSRRQEVERKIAQARARGKEIQIAFEQGADSGPKSSRVLLPAGPAPEAGADIWLVVYDEVHETEVARGENSGHTLTDYNVVRELSHLGTWTGAAKTLPLDLNEAANRGRAGAAVIVQHRGSKAVLGAGLLRLQDLALN